MPCVQTEGTSKNFENASLLTSFLVPSRSFLANSIRNGKKVYKMNRVFVREQFRPLRLSGIRESQHFKLNFEKASSSRYQLLVVSGAGCIDFRYRLQVSGATLSAPGHNSNPVVSRGISWHSPVKRNRNQNTKWHQ